MEDERGSLHEMPAHVMGKVLQYPCFCSCPMCGNPRRIKGGWAGHPLTMQERRADDDYKDQLKEL